MSIGSRHYAEPREREPEPPAYHERLHPPAAPQPGPSVTTLPDYRTQAPPCIVCGAHDTEFNHWLPQMFAERPEVAPEWDAWANIGAPLCRHHHALWHRIVTPYMPGIGQSRT